MLKDFNRPQYKKLLRKIKIDDLLYIKTLCIRRRNTVSAIADDCDGVAPDKQRQSVVVRYDVFIVVVAIQFAAPNS